MEYALRTHGITKIYGKRAVVDHVSMNVKKVDIYGFIGKNGAGNHGIVWLGLFLNATDGFGYVILTAGAFWGVDVKG